jgi:hypothetical protein
MMPEKKQYACQPAILLLSGFAFTQSSTRKGLQLSRLCKRNVTSYQEIISSRFLSV